MAQHEAAYLTGSLACVKRILLVTGSGRSGTSSVAGTLKRLGLHVPQPEVPADEKNPLGYYEPRWVAAFHKGWLDNIHVRTIDTRPHAGDVAMETVTPEREEKLRTWVADELAARPDDDVVVIKETRAYWVYPLWQRVVAAVGAELTSLTMLRHPTQVVRSRDTAYLSGRSDEFRLARETSNVAAWMNSVFVTERATRDNPRAFVPYYDLVEDWRSAISRACEQLGIDTGDLAAPHPVDEFITPSLNRSDDAWDGLTVPDVAEGPGRADLGGGQPAGRDPDDEKARAELDRLAAAYADVYATAAALASDEKKAAVLAEQHKLQDRLDTKNKRIEKLRQEVHQLRGEGGGE